MEIARQEVIKKRKQAKKLDGFQKMADEILDDTAYDEIDGGDSPWLS